MNVCKRQMYEYFTVILLFSISRFTQYFLLKNDSLCTFFRKRGYLFRLMDGKKKIFRQKDRAGILILCGNLTPTPLQRRGNCSGGFNVGRLFIVAGAATG
jgi:hypothetical protein